MSQFLKSFREYGKIILVLSIVSGLSLYFGFYFQIVSPLLSSLLVNISASFIFSIFAIIFIDTYRESNKKKEWSKVETIVKRRLSSVCSDFTFDLSYWVNLFPKVPTDVVNAKKFYDEMDIENEKNFNERVVAKILEITEKFPTSESKVFNQTISKLQRELESVTVSYISVLNPAILSSILLLQESIGYFQFMFALTERLKTADGKFLSKPITPYVAELLKRYKDLKSLI